MDDSGISVNTCNFTSLIPTTEQRAELTQGTSSEAIYKLVARVIQGQHVGGGTLLDVGCGAGELWKYVRNLFDIYAGSDVIRYEGFPLSSEFYPVNLDSGRVALSDGAADVVACVETIEHVENPRALVRELARLARPGGLILVTTPNQISLLSKLGLILKDQFPAFQQRPGLYPAHITALLPIDLDRMARESGLSNPTIRYSNSGRIPATRLPWPRPLAGRLFSDNVLVAARRP